MMDKNNFQEESWKSCLGKEYTERNPKNTAEMDELYIQNYGISRTELNKDFLERISRDIKILEVGCNVGVQLQALREMGFLNLYGIEINREAIKLSKSLTKNIDIIQASVLDVPFKDDSFDLVFTSGLLIHISSDNIKKAMEEIHRCTKKYIWGFEYHANSYTPIIYRRQKNLLWKTNFPKLYLKNFKDLRLIKERKLNYLNNENTDIMFLLKKK